MIETKELREGEVVVVDLAGDKSEYIESENVKCRFVNGYFQNIENNHHKGEIYGSSVVFFSASPNTIELQDTPEQLGKEIYRLLCGKKKEGA